MLNLRHLKQWDNGTVDELQRYGKFVTDDRWSVDGNNYRRLLIAYKGINWSVTFKDGEFDEGSWA